MYTDISYMLKMDHHSIHLYCTPLLSTFKGPCLLPS